MKLHNFIGKCLSLQKNVFEIFLEADVLWLNFWKWKSKTTQTKLSPSVQLLLLLLLDFFLLKQVRKRNSLYDRLNKFPFFFFSLVRKKKTEKCLQQKVPIMAI